MAKKIYVVTDLGPGDGGKGGVVHKVATMMNAHTVVKVGGAQGKHGVCTSRGEQFAFGQWGCGTFEGIKTHISQNMLITPVGLLNEAEALQYQLGVHNALSLLTVDSRALCATPYHGIASRLKELARGNNPRGTIGTGVGEAYRFSNWYPKLNIRAADLSRSDIKDMLFEVRKQVRFNIAQIYKGEYLPEDREEAFRENDLLYDDGYLDFVADLFRETAKRINIVSPEYFANEILSQNGNIVVESSHGVLTDNFYGFSPHTSALRTLPCFTHAMLKEEGYDGKIVNIGVSRAYTIRHGAGPMPTDSPEMAENLLPGSHKENDRYQGKVRVGPLDLNLLRYAIEVCGGPSAFDGLTVTWFDQIQKNGIWHMCDRYHGADNAEFFLPNGDIKVRRGENEEQLKHQEALGRQLMSCVPEISSIEIPRDAEQDKLYSFCADVLNEKTGIPVRMVSFGPTERDKVCK